MKANLKILAKFILPIIMLVSISCGKKSLDGSEIIYFNNGNVSYKVNENYSKINFHNIDQCERFLEYKSSEDSFEIYGADIADLLSIFYNIERNRIDLKDKKPIFYSIIYSGSNNSEIKKDIFKQLINRRNLKVSKVFSEKDFERLTFENSKKMKTYLSSKNEEEGNVIINDNRYELENVNFKIFTNTLNEIYSNSFIYEGNTNEKYNLVIPLGMDKNSIVNYLEDKYDINVTRVGRKSHSYEIISN